MSEYYAVQRSDNSLKHYGVRGMKWGVRKAIKSGNVKKLSKQYNKAAKKLQRMENKANVKNLGQKYNKLRENQKTATRAGLGMLGGGVGVGVAKAAKAFSTGARKITLKPGLGSALALGGLGTLAAGKAYKVMARRTADKMSPEGQAKAKKKIETYKNEMKNAFKDTKYKNLPKVNTKTKTSTTAKKKERKYFTKSDIKQAFKTAALGAVVGPVAANYTMSKKTANETPSNNNRQGKKRRKTT